MGKTSFASRLNLFVAGMCDEPHRDANVAVNLEIFIVRILFPRFMHIFVYDLLAFFKPASLGDLQNRLEYLYPVLF